MWHMLTLEMDSSIWEMEKKKENLKEKGKIRGEKARWEGTERENLNNGVKPKNTGPVMDAAL